MMRMSFTGIGRNAANAVESLKKLIDEMYERDQVFEDERDEFHTDAGTIETCLSAYHDTILAIVKGDVTLEQVKDFWLHGDDVSKIAYRGGVLKIIPEGESIT